MLIIKRHKSFLKDLRKVKLSDKHYSKYILYVSKLIEEKPLPEEALNHPLKGNLPDIMNFMSVVMYWLYTNSRITNFG